MFSDVGYRVFMMSLPLFNGMDGTNAAAAVCHCLRHTFVCSLWCFLVSSFFYFLCHKTNKHLLVGIFSCPSIVTIDVDVVVVFSLFIFLFMTKQTHAYNHYHSPNTSTLTHPVIHASFVSPMSVHTTVSLLDTRQLHSEKWAISLGDH